MADKIYITGCIDDDSFRQFSEELTESEKKSGKRIVEIEINSYGGSASDALAFYGRIIRSPCTINITAYGLVASAAVLIFAACKKRRITAESWLMVHEDEDQLKNARTSQFEKHAAYMRRMEDQWINLLEKLTGTDKEIWAILHKEETYLTAAECLVLGIADEVI